MEKALQTQKEAFIKNGPPNYKLRIDRLRRCIALIKGYEPKIIEALNQDFKNRSIHEIKISEIDQTIRNLLFTIKNLKKWMRPQKRMSSLGTGLLGARALMTPTPLGSVGIIAPWNFPVAMVFYPATSILAAGNSIMAKPSEITPATSSLIKEAVDKYFDVSEFAVFLGGPKTGQRFSSLSHDHLLYTGSGKVAKKVLEVASKNLIPTTLELGGKSPTIISDDAKLSLAAKRILFAKTLNSGQICLSPDYIFLKKGLENNFVSELKKTFSKFYNNNANDYTSMVNTTHYNRMQSYLDDAIKKGATVTSLGELDSKEKNTISTKLIFGVNDTMEVMKNEIFGPLLPVMLYEDLSEVADYINKHDHPLGLYFFGKNKYQQDYIINNTRSGGVTINDTMFHLLQSRLPFGGVGSSGYGYYHGYEGFLNFSNLRAIYHQTSSDAILSLIRPPRGRLFNLLSSLMKRLG